MKSDIITNLNDAANALDLEAGPDEWLAQAGKMDAAVEMADRWIKQVKAERDALYKQRIEQSGEFTVGTIRRYIGFRNETKCIDVGRAVDAIFTAVDGDLVAAASCLSSNALKPGECRRVLGDQFGSHFVTERKDEVKRVIVADTRFTQQRESAA